MATTTNTTPKVTNKDFYNAFKSLANGEQISLTPEQISDWCDKKIEQLAKKAGSPSKPTAKQTENEALKAEILQVLRENGGYMTIKDIITNSEVLTSLGVVNQRVSALLRQLGQSEVGTGEVEKKMEKRVAYFKAVEVEENAE